MLASVVGAFYYLRIIKIMWFDEGEDSFVPISIELRLVLGASGIFVMMFYLFAGPIFEITSGAASSLF